MVVPSSIILPGVLAFIVVLAVATADDGAHRMGVAKVKREAAFWKRNSAFWKRDTDAMLATAEHEDETESLEDGGEQEHTEHVLGKRDSSYLGKRPRNNFLGKRAGDDVDFDTGLEELKRARQHFLGKRGRQQFLGKRARVQFLGKRDDGNDEFIVQDDLDNYDLKRAKYFLGKRADYLYGGDSNQDFDDVEDIKRAKYFLGKRRFNFLGRR